MTRSKEYVEGYERAEHEWMVDEPGWMVNPYPLGTDQYEGYKDAVYNLTQK